MKPDERRRAQAARQQRGAPGAERGRNSGKSAGAAREIAPLDRNRFDDETERDGHHGKIRTRDPKRRDRQSRRYRCDHQNGQRQRLPEVQAGLGREDADPIRSQCQKSALTKRYLAGEPKQDIQPDAGKGGGCQRSQQVGVVAGRNEADGDGGTADQRRGNSPKDGSHTRTLVRPPNKPDGASTSAAMTAENVTIWVLLEPSQVVAQASTRP